jgi:2-dehydro-3-deoxyphosphogluconate aldolase/(4S)-4-hydroxy-2-oxoglutarate aldolase
MPIAKLGVLGETAASGLVCAIRADSPDQAGRIAEACALGGVAAMEITFTVPGAKTRDFASITRLARAITEKIKEARGR